MTDGEPRPLRDATRVLRAGLPAPAQGAPPPPGPPYASPFPLEGAPATAPYVYGRYGNPTWTLYERALEELEDGPATVFASGMAAAAAVLLPLLRPGDALVAPADGYPAVRSLASRHLASCGVDVRLLPSSEPVPDSALAGARLGWLASAPRPGAHRARVRGTR